MCVCGLCHLTLCTDWVSTQWVYTAVYYHRASVCVCVWSLSFDIVLSQSQRVCVWSLSFDIVHRLSVHPVSVHCCVLSQSQCVCVCGLCHLTLYYHRASVCVCGLCHLTLYYHRASVCEWSLSFDIVHRLSVYPVTVHCCVLSQSQRVCVCVVSVIWHCARTECLPSECTLLCTIRASVCVCGVSLIWHCTITEPACVCVVSVIWHCAQTECLPSECTLLCTIPEPACVCGLCHLTLYYHRASMCRLCHLTLCQDWVSTRHRVHLQPAPHHSVFSHNTQPSLIGLDFPPPITDPCSVRCRSP